MAAPLQFKQRVHLPELGEPVLPRSRRSGALAFGIAVWAVCVAAAWGVDAGTFPVSRWLDAAASTAPIARRPIARRAVPAEPARVALAVPTAPLPEPEPVPLPPAEPAPPPAAAEPAVAPPLPEPTLARAPALAPPPAPTGAPMLALAPAPKRTPETAPSRPAFRAPEPEPALALTFSPAVTRPEPAKPLPAGGASSVGKSCEAAAAAYHDEIRIGKDRGPPDLGAEDYGRVLNDGRWFSACRVPDSSAIDVCVAVQNGHAVGVTVRTTPRAPAVERCIGRAASRLRFPSHPRLDVARTRF